MVTIIHDVLQANNTTQWSDVKAAKMCAAKAAKIALRLRRIEERMRRPKY